MTDLVQLLLCAFAPLRDVDINAGMPELPLVLVTEGSDRAPLAWLKEQARVIEASPDTPAYDAGCRTWWAWWCTLRKVNALSGPLSKLKVVGRGGVGIETSM